MSEQQKTVVAAGSAASEVYKSQEVGVVIGVGGTREA